MGQELERIIQESVPGKQVTIAHVIACSHVGYIRPVGY